jgi:peptidoglycan hydrolase-like protein with peptidoglycan-binding domain
MPTTLDNEMAMLTWGRSEFGTQAPTPAAYNLLATTLSTKTSTKFNAAGVQNFKTFDDGVSANASVLTEDHPGYDAVRSALTAGHSAEAVIAAVDASAWGSHPTVEMLSAVRARWPYDALLWVGPDEGDVHTTPQVIGPPFPGVDLADFHQGDGTAVWQAQMHHRGWNIQTDDKYGPASAHVAQAFQAEKALQVDGIVGPITWAASWSAPIT